MLGAKNALFVAGGTGGHIHAALELGRHFQQLGYGIFYATGKRALDYKLFIEHNAVHLNASPLYVKSPSKFFISLVKNIIAFVEAFIFLIKNRPAFVFGAGGYVCGPVIVAAKILWIPCFILEQNSVLGLTNKLLMQFADKCFVNFERTNGLPDKFKSKVIVSGNPVRKDLLTQYNNYQETDDDYFHLLVFGGSLGAESINNLIYKLLEEGPGIKLHIIHQTGLGKIATSFNKSPHSQVKYDPREFIHNMGELYAWSDLVISRSGASSVSELMSMNKPVIFIPYPSHKDRHQFYNAENFQKNASTRAYINSVEELLANNCYLLKNIITKEANEQRTQSKSQIKEEEFLRPSTVIQKAIEENV